MFIMVIILLLIVGMAINGRKLNPTLRSGEKKNLKAAVKFLPALKFRRAGEDVKISLLMFTWGSGILEFQLITTGYLPGLMWKLSLKLHALSIRVENKYGEHCILNKDIALSKIFRQAWETRTDTGLGPVDMPEPTMRKWAKLAYDRFKRNERPCQVCGDYIAMLGKPRSEKLSWLVLRSPLAKSIYIMDNRFERLLVQYCCFDCAAGESKVWDPDKS
jgi:hypothetical protein